MAAATVTERRNEIDFDELSGLLARLEDKLRDMG
jgi:hypothetical protein